EGSGDDLAAALGPFAAIGEAMAEVRAHTPAPSGAEAVEEQRREAAMRVGLRAAVREFDRVAVVCGAWHVPALTAPLTTAVTDAALAVLCEGDPLRLELIERRLVVGERLGRVPQRTPGVPIARDVAAAQRRLRLPPQPLPRELDLDLRREIDLERSRLLHRL